MSSLKDSARHIDNPVCPVLSKICGVGFSLVFIGPSIAMLVVGIKLRGDCPADKNIPVFMIGRPREIFFWFKSQRFLKNLGQSLSALAISGHLERFSPGPMRSEVGHPGMLFMAN